MYAAIATLGLSFLLTFFSVGVSEAELWVCSQPGGGTLFTDVPQTDGSCEKHEPVSQLNYAPPINWANVPPPDATYEWQEINVPDAQWESRSDEQETVPSDASGGYSPEQSSWGYDQNPVFTFYSYTPGFYGVPYFRHKYQRDLPHKPQRQHEMPHISSIPFNSTTQTPGTHFREHSIRSISPQVLPQTVPPTGTRSPHSPNSSFRAGAPVAPSHSAPPAFSRHARESSVAVAPGAPPHSAYTTTPIHVQRNSVGGVAEAPPQSSSPTSSGHFRAHSGEAGVSGAPLQSPGFRQDTKH